MNFQKFFLCVHLVHRDRIFGTPYHAKAQLQKIFHLLQEKSNKISFVPLFHFTFYVYFWSVKILSPNMSNCLFPAI
jgi:hypothetical protein